jgi:hypothetical protein
VARTAFDHGPGAHDDVANAVAGAIVLASHHEVPLNFHVPIIHSVPRSDLLPISAVDGLYTDATMPPGGWPAGSLQSDGSLSWWPGMKN